MFLWLCLSNIACMYDHFAPAGLKLNSLLKPTILHLHSIFVLDVDGQLHEHAKASASACVGCMMVTRAAG